MASTGSILAADHAGANPDTTPDDGRYAKSEHYIPEGKEYPEIIDQA